MLSGRLYHGHGGTAGEIGHVTIDEAGPVCRCGNRGCLEAFAGAEAVLEPLRRRHGERLTLRQVVAQAQAGDVGCRRVIADAGRASASPSAASATSWRPSASSSAASSPRAGDLLLDAAARGVERSAIAATREVPVLAGVLGERAEVLGAVALVLRESRRYVAEPAGVGQA